MFVVPLRVEMPNLRNYITTLWEYLQCTYRSFAVLKLHSVISFFSCLSSADCSPCRDLCDLLKLLMRDSTTDAMTKTTRSTVVSVSIAVCLLRWQLRQEMCRQSRELLINAKQLTVGLWKSWRIRIHHQRHRQHQHNNSSSTKSLWWWFCSKAAFVFIIPSHTEWTLTVR